MQCRVGHKYRDRYWNRQRDTYRDMYRDRAKDRDMHMGYRCACHVAADTYMACGI